MPPPPPPGAGPYGAPVDPYGAPPAFPPPPRKRSTGKIIAIIVVVVLLLLCACGVGAFFVAGQLFDEFRRAPDSPSPTLATPERTPQPRYEEGDCVLNEGTDADARLRKVPCAPGTFEVVARVLFTTDRSMCENPVLGAGRGRYDSTYTHQGDQPPADSYVLCLKRR
ncbi:MAG TPA: hypothetical protein VFY17_07865 [Pilimelia sp.]|nr:hypothetical protein [Pilimelia sp.]